MLALLDNVGLVIVVVFLTYHVLKRVVGALVDLSFGSTIDTPELRGNPVPDIPGLHVFSYFEDERRLVDKNPTEATIRSTIRSLDWVDGFHTVVLVASPDVSLEVGGSLEPGVGFSSSYRDLKNEIHKITKEAPETIADMEDLMVSFHLSDGRWDRLNEYD